jgi:hypothetical protein
VSEYSRQEIAQRAGVDSDCVDRLVELGILTPAAGAAFSPGDALRAVGYRALSGPACTRRGGCRCPEWRALVLLPGRARVRSIRRVQRHNLPGAEQQDGHHPGAADGGPRGLRLRGATAGGPGPPERAVGRSGDRVELAKGFHPVVIERWLRGMTEGETPAARHCRRDHHGRTRTPRYRVCSSPSQRRSDLRPDPDAVQHPLITFTLEAPGSPSSGGWTCHRRGGLGVASCKLSRVTVNRAAVPAAWPTDGCSLPSSLTPKANA